MTVCDECGGSKPRRQIKVKDLLYGKAAIQYDLCENCFRKKFKSMIDNRAKAGNMK